MPQTRFVLRKALAMKLKVIVVINKIDKPDARINEVLNRTFDLFIELGADDETADFPVIYAAAKLGKAGLEPKLDEMTDITPVFEAILKHIKEPSCDPAKPLQLLITTITADNFKGRIATGRITNGTLQAGQNVMHINRDGVQKQYRITTLMTLTGLNRIEIETASAGDIVAIAGIGEVNIGEAIADINNPIALPVLNIEEPDCENTFSVNDPLLVRKVNLPPRQIQNAYKELETDMALRVEDSGTD